MKMICGIHLRAGGPAPGLDAPLGLPVPQIFRLDLY